MRPQRGTETTGAATPRPGCALLARPPGSALRVRKRKRLMTKDDWRMICETIELVLYRAEQRYKEQRRKEHEEAKGKGARRRSAS